MGPLWGGVGGEEWKIHEIDGACVGWCCSCTLSPHPPPPRRHLCSASDSSKVVPSTTLPHTSFAGGGRCLSRHTPSTLCACAHPLCCGERSDCSRVVGGCVCVFLCCVDRLPPAPFAASHKTQTRPQHASNDTLSRARHVDAVTGGWVRGMHWVCVADD